MIVPLPFAYVAMFRESSRHQPRPYRIRGYVFVDLPEIGRRDMTVVLTHEVRSHYSNEPRRRCGEILHWRGRLFEAVKEGELLVTADRFAEALAVPPSRYNRGQDLVRFGSAFPTPDVRSGEEASLDPCCLPNLDQQQSELGLPRHEFVSDDFEAKSGAAQLQYVEQILLVDGQVHVECPEPVWELDARTSAPEWTLRPTRDRAVRTYRLDRLPGAERDCSRAPPSCTDPRGALARSRSSSLRSWRETT